MLAQKEAGVQSVYGHANGRLMQGRSGDGMFDDKTVETGKDLQKSDPTNPANPRIDPIAIDRYQRPGRGVPVNGYSGGEDEELSVMRTLWDLYDNANAGDFIDGQPTRNLDDVNLGYADLFSLITGSKVKTLADLSKALHQKAFTNGQLDYKALANFGGVFELNNVAPRPKEMQISGTAALTWRTGNAIPTFVFDWPNDSSGAAALNRAWISFYDDTGKELYSEYGVTSGYQPSRDHWDNDIAKVAGVKHWIVAGAYSDGRVRTGYLYSGSLDFNVVK